VARLGRVERAHRLQPQPVGVVPGVHQAAQERIVASERARVLAIDVPVVEQRDEQVRASRRGELQSEIGLEAVLADG
jgi:hypothetical protein